MKTKRDWLAEQGLAIAGARGKFSRDAMAALKAEEDRCKAENIPLPWVEKEKPVPGRRGRKPKEKTSIGLTKFEQANMTDEEAAEFYYENRSDSSTAKIPVIANIPYRREQDHAFVIDQNGFLIAIQFCGKCSKSIRRCVHDVPYAPDYLGGGLATFEKPVV